MVIDRFEPALLRAVEETRYERREPDFRFENSDLFGLGPLITDLREHPRGELRRVLFFGNSITYGYLLNAADAVPAHYQRLDTTAKVFNVGINGFDTGSSFLIAKAAVDSVDLVYSFVRATPAPTRFSRRSFPSRTEICLQFHFSAPNQTERILSRAANHWRLYRGRLPVAGRALGHVDAAVRLAPEQGARSPAGRSPTCARRNPSRAPSDETVTH